MLPDPPPSAGRRSERAPGRHRQSQDSNLLGVVTRTPLHGRAWAAAPSGCHQGGCSPAGCARAARQWQRQARVEGIADRHRLWLWLWRSGQGSLVSLHAAHSATPLQLHASLSRSLPAPTAPAAATSSCAVCCPRAARCPRARRRRLRGTLGGGNGVRWCGNLACVSDICPDDALLRLPSPLKYSSANAQPNLPGLSADSRTLTSRLTARPLLASR